MIIQISAELFFSKDNQTLTTLTEIIRILIFDKGTIHIWDNSNFDANLYGSLINSTWFENFLSKSEQDVVKIYIRKESFFLNEENLHYLRCENLNSQADLLSFVAEVSEPSFIILENATNDWNFIRGIVRMYTNNKKRKRIYKRLSKAIENRSLRPDNAGGLGEMQNRIQSLNEHISYKKLMTLFDSDKKSQEEDLNNSKLSLISFLKNKNDFEIKWESSDLIVWHMLFKREMENYIPKEFILRKHPNAELQSNDEQYDYLDIEGFYMNILNRPKVELPRLFLSDDLKRGQMEEHCNGELIKVETPNGTLEPVSEIELILIKLAKII